MKQFIQYFVVTLIVCMSLPPIAVKAAEPAVSQGMRVYVRVEDTDRCVASGWVYAYTFREAAEALAVAYGLTLTFSHSGESSVLLAVEETSDESTVVKSVPGAWLGCVNRTGDIFTQDDYLQIPLVDDDEVILYRGGRETSVLTHLTCEITAEGTLTFFAGIEETDWYVEDGLWMPESVLRPVEDVTVRAILPGSGEIAVVTNADGIASSADFKEIPGVVLFYAEDVRTDKIPAIVRTAKMLTPCGFGPESYVTRAQAAAFWVNMYGDGKPETNGARGASVSETTPASKPVAFNDVQDSQWYASIMAAAEQGWVIGMGSGLFGPDTPADLMQICVMAARALSDSEETGAETVVASANETSEYTDDSATKSNESVNEKSDTATVTSDTANEISKTTNETTAAIETATDAAHTTDPQASSTATPQPAAEAFAALTALTADDILSFTELTDGVLPSWAEEAAYALYRAGYLDGIELAWAEPVTPEVLTRLYANLPRR